MRKLMNTILFLFLLLTICCVSVFAQETVPELIDIQILATSDLHGKMLPWDYLLNAESNSGSMAQLASAIQEKRDENTLVLDAGDSLQDNMADLFINNEIHPMIQAMNYIGYDACTTGNHEYNYGTDILRKVLPTLEAEVLLGNVYDEKGELLGEPYAIFERSGIRIAVVGMVTPNIVHWDGEKLIGWTVTNPADECRKLMPELKEKADLIIGLVHMGLNNEYDMAGSGVKELAASCPEFNVIIAAHDHKLIEGEKLNGVLVIENKNQAQTLNEIHLMVRKTEQGCEVVSISSDAISMASYEPDAELTALLTPAHEQGLAVACEVIGRLEGGDLCPENEIPEVSASLLQDTALMDLILNSMMYSSGAKVAAAALTKLDTNMKQGEIHKYDISRLYRYSNMLYLLRMTGSQLKAYMEWSASFYQQYREGDLTVSFQPDIRCYNYDMFSGVNYLIDISKPAGERIVNLTWLDGTPVAMDESFPVAVTDYRYNSQMLIPGAIFEEDNMPVLVEANVQNKEIRTLIIDYIREVNDGVITPVVDHNWRIIGNQWDEALHQKAVEQLRTGLIAIPKSEDGRTVNVQAITVDDLK